MAIALFSFPSFAAFEKYQVDLMTDPRAAEVIAYHAQNRCFLSYAHRFFRPLMPQ